MKKFYIILIVLFVITVSSCQRSQFSTTTRHYKNGRVTYVNHYPAERTKSAKVSVRKSHIKETEAQNNSIDPDRTEAQKFPKPEITKLNPVPIHDYENLIASTSNEPTIIPINENRVISKNELILSDNNHFKAVDTRSHPDTIKSNATKKRTARDSITYQVIKFKNGNEEKVRIVNISDKTLSYNSIKQPNITVGVPMEQIDTILPYTGKEIVSGTRKTEKLGIVGLIFSILGLVPLLGIPFALVSIILLSVSLGKIKRHPEKFKGKGIAIAGLTIWIIGLIIYLILNLTVFWS